ncbi:Vesicular glutamate transporter 3 [Armadillidium nasatum]|uniref:Vesicular glutamate transporter 3 n=1 Tax=Armadillidium nasatum TaxID=96803 RepID=A0A5N5SLK9_9CRUS|nr:Vesicular glutamate transporter 3 [Armadillidium nasatum]
MVAFTYSGIAIGAALGGPFSEYILKFIGWRTLFYTQGILALLWGMFWFFLVSDSPSNHPKITNKERQKILTSIGQQHAGKGVAVPWCSIIRSQHVLALMLAQGSFKFEFVWGAALTSMFVVTCAYGAIADWLRKSRKTSTEFVRRAANSICSLLTAAFLVGVAQSYCHISAVKVCFAFAIAVGIPGAFSGIYVNSIDLAPNHAAVITGICGTFATTANILAPFYWGLIVYERPTLERWRTIWYTSAIFLLLANCLYFLLVGTKEQRWNRPVTLTKGNKRREEDQGAISKRRMNYTHGFKNQAYVSTEHL